MPANRNRAVTSMMYVPSSPSTESRCLTSQPTNSRFIDLAISAAASS
jgi:hypothetical protein